MENLKNKNKSKKFNVLLHIFITTLIISTTNETLAAPKGKFIRKLVSDRYEGNTLPLNRLSAKGRSIYSAFIETAIQREWYTSNHVFLKSNADKLGSYAETNFLLDTSTNLAQAVRVNYETGTVTRFALYVPKVKEAHKTHLATSPFLEKTKVHQTYIDKNRGKIERIQYINFAQIDNHYYKYIDRSLVYTDNQNIDITLKNDSMIDITKGPVGATKTSAFWLPNNIEGQVTQVHINETGTRFSFVTTKGKIYKYIIEDTPKNGPPDQGPFTFKQDLDEVDNPNYPERGKQIPREKLNEILYADVKIAPGVKSVQESTASQIDIAPSPTTHKTQATPGTVE